MPARVLVTCHRIQSRILRYGTAKEYFEVDKYYTTFCDTKNRYNLQLALTLGNALSLQLCSTLVKHLEKNLLMKQLLRTFQIHLSNPTKDTHILINNNYTASFGYILQLTCCKPRHRQRCAGNATLVTHFLWNYYNYRGIFQASLDAQTYKYPLTKRNRPYN